MNKRLILSFAFVGLTYAQVYGAGAVNIRIAALNDMQDVGCQVVIGVTNSWQKDLTRGALDIEYLDRNDDVIGTDIAIYDRMGRLDVEQTQTLPVTFRCYELRKVRLGWGELTAINRERASDAILTALTGITFVKLNDDVPVNGRSPSRKQIQIDMPGCAICIKSK